MQENTSLQNPIDKPVNETPGVPPLSDIDDPMAEASNMDAPGQQEPEQIPEDPPLIDAPPFMDFSDAISPPVYDYDAETGEFKGSFDASLDPMASQRLQEPVWGLPAHATFTAPDLVQKDGHTIVWDKDAEKWIYKEDNRGKIYWTKDGRNIERHEMTELGALPDNALLEEPEYEPTPEELAQSVRNWRSVKLQEYDNAHAQLERAKRLATDEAKIAAIDSQLLAWDLYANTLCDLPSLDGFPWDGGGENTPWPEAPVSPANFLAQL